MSIEVHVRVRPGVDRCVWSSAETVLYSTANPNTRYVYNKVHPSNSSNSAIFKGIEAIAHAAFDGKNVTVMAYGQTGSGKTHSMIGTDDDSGIVPRTARLLLELRKHTHGTAIRAYYTEIYNESVKDLLEPQRGELALHDAPDGGVFFEKKTVEVETFDDFLRLQSAAERNRKYGVTNLNDHSSRSHIILTFEIHRNNRAGKSVLNLVDLAGSESAARANTEGQSLREGGFINRSLLTLGNVVDAIVEKRPYVPYRDAKLTRILRTCLGGSGITFILCCINPSRDNFDQTVATLRFTQRAMKIKNDPVVVLTIPPLFTHQYSDGARQLIEGVQEASEAEYQRGLRDGYMYCANTATNVVTTFQSQVAHSMHALANAQRLLIAHDHATAIDRMGRLYNQLNELARQRAGNKELIEAERHRQRDITSEIEHRRAKAARLEEEIADKATAADTDLAGWEYRLHEARQRQISELDLVVKAETARRARVQYEWAVCMERISARCVPALKMLLPLDTEEVTLPSPSPARGLSPHASRAATLAQLRRAVQTARGEYADLALAHEMVRDDIELVRQRQRQQRYPERPPLPSSASLSPAPMEVAGCLRGDDNGDEIERQIDFLEREERRLMSRAKREVRRESIRRARESLRNTQNHSPQARAITAGERGRVMESHSVDGSRKPVTGSGARASPGIRRDGSTSTGARDSYADGVRSALSVLDGLKSRLLQGQRQYPRKRGSSSASRGPYYERKGSRRPPGTTVDDDVPLSDLYGGRGPATAGGAPSSSGADNYASGTMNKENVHYQNSSPLYHPRKHGGNDDSFIDDVAANSSPPCVGIAARRHAEQQQQRGGGRHQRRDYVERTLYSIHSNSQSPSASLERRSRSRCQ